MSPLCQNLFSSPLLVQQPQRRPSGRQKFTLFSSPVPATPRPEGRGPRLSAVMCPQTVPVYFMFDLAGTESKDVPHVYLTPFGHFVRGETSVTYVPASRCMAGRPLSRSGVIAATEWAHFEYSVRAGLRENPVAGFSDWTNIAQPCESTPQPRSEPATSSVTPVYPVPSNEFLFYVQRFAIVMSTVMLIRKAVDASVFEAMEA